MNASEVFEMVRNGGVFATKELAQEHIDWSREVFDHKSQYDIVEETVIGKQ